MSALLLGYARCATDQQDLTAQRDGLAALGVTPDRIYVDHLNRPGFRGGSITWIRPRRGRVFQGSARA